DPQRGAALDSPAQRPSAGTGVLGCHYGWYNTRRIQKELGYLSPNEYETAWHSQTQPAEPPIATPAPAGSR
ncbi:IS3 family transposase, partial [Micromonospora sp. DT31]|uniref:IS3 family transposase n=1 Tax=Micromonospora sp. DT31 TaxID=3393434 RepID=UPI003CF1D0B7